MSSGLKHQLSYFDAVRGASAQLVVLGHGAVLAFPELFAIRARDGTYAARPDQFHVQSFGVLVFLVLSGFLIAGSVRRRRSADPDYGLRAFMIDRWARIFTPLLPALVLVVVVDRWLFAGGARSPFIVLHDDRWTVLGNVLMLQDNAVMRDLARITGLPVFVRSVGSAAPWWTVALEWWIYVAFGIIALVFATRPSTLRCLVALPLLIFAGGSLLGALHLGNGLLLAWLIGFAYAWWPDVVGSWSRPVHLAITVLASAWVWWTYAVMARQIYSPIACALTGIAVMSAYHVIDWGRLLGPVRRLVTFASDSSYSLYLIHFSIMVWLLKLLDGRVTGVRLYLLLVLACNVAGVVWWWAFERRFPQVRDALRRALLPTTRPARTAA